MDLRNSNLLEKEPKFWEMLDKDGLMPHMVKMKDAKLEITKAFIYGWEESTVTFEGRCNKLDVNIMVLITNLK